MNQNRLSFGDARRFSRFLITTGAALLCLGCPSIQRIVLSSEQDQEPDKPITIEESRELIVRFINVPKNAKYLPSVVKTLETVKKQPATTNTLTGEFRMGPWQVHPRKKTATYFFNGGAWILHFEQVKERFEVTSTTVLQERE